MDFLIGALARVSSLLPPALAAIDRAHLQWAVREISPTHPDVPYIVHRLRNLEDQRNA